MNNLQNYGFHNLSWLSLFVSGNKSNIFFYWMMNISNTEILLILFPILLLIRHCITRWDAFNNSWSGEVLPTSNWPNCSHLDWNWHLYAFFIIRNVLWNSNYKCSYYITISNIYLIFLNQNEKYNHIPTFFISTVDSSSWELRSLRLSISSDFKHTLEIGVNPNKHFAMV